MEFSRPETGKRVYREEGLEGFSAGATPNLGDHLSPRTFLRARLQHSRPVLLRGEGGPRVHQGRDSYRGEGGRHGAARGDSRDEAREDGRADRAHREGTASDCVVPPSRRRGETANRRGSRRGDLREGRAEVADRAQDNEGRHEQVVERPGASG